ncbi:MAG TPA: Ig-like domain-containing protein [Nocardioidaceae bacterium]|nr:Ig-like domain-containing protein [Nocardioidaceae bacterium]
MSKNTSVRRSAALLSVAAMATTGLIATAVPANAVITPGPEEDPVTGFPTYMVDDQGLALQMCLDACLEVPEPGEEPDPEAPTTADPNHAPYFSAEAVAGLFTVSYEVATDAEVEGQPGELVNAAGVGARGVTPGARYRVQGPWGSFTVTADDRGRVQAERLNAVEGFLRPVGASGEMLGDAHTFTRVTGSPTGFNRVKITGPGVNASTNVFALAGQKAADTAMTAVNVKSASMNQNRVTRQIRYTNFGTAAATPTVRVGGLNAGRFQVVQDVATVEAGQSSLITVTYTPQANRSHSAILSVSDNSLAALPKTVALSGKGPDTLAPRLQSRTPGKGATVRRGKSVKVQFSEAVRGLNRSTFTLVDRSNNRKVAATVSKRGNSYVLNPRRALKRGTSYIVKLNGGARQIRDTSNNAARDMQWKFRTR